MSKTLLTDLYQLTMMAAYVDHGIDDTATFDLFIRKLPKDWGYFIANGIEDGIDYATTVAFKEDQLDYLHSQQLFKPSFFDYLRNFRFTGDIYAVPQGTVVFPNEPIMRITANRTQAQFLETALLNMVNFQTMISSKSSRNVDAAFPAGIVGFGLRRAQEEDAGVKGARAAYIGGAVATSNVKAGMLYDIPITGTQAHSFVMSFPSEIESFRAYAQTFPNNTVLLIDTYDTLQGAKNAAKVGREMQQRGEQLKAVRLDSGDLLDLSKKVRSILNEQGLTSVQIFASSDLNEYKIEHLVNNGAPIDAYGVGTELITAKPTAAISGVYKLAQDKDGPKMKFSSNKISYPGIKEVYRFSNNGHISGDVIGYVHEHIPGERILQKVVEHGERIYQRRNVQDTRTYARSQVERLHPSLRQVKVQEKYVVEPSLGLLLTMKDLQSHYVLEHN